MGKNTPEKLSESGVIAIQSPFYIEFSLAGLTAFVCKYQRLLVLYACIVIFSQICAAQTASFSAEQLSEQIARGNIEQKRDALFQIRNLKTPEASRVALPALNDSSEIVRAAAAKSIVFLPSEDAVPALLPLLKDKKFFVRKEAAYALGHTRSPNAVQPLLEIIRRDKIQEVKDAATVALGEIGETAAITELTPILPRPIKVKEDFFRRAVARSIGQIAERQQTGNLQINTPENFLPEKSKFQPNQVYKNLSEIIPQFQNSVSALIQTLQNPRETDDVKRETAFALGAIGDKSAVPVLTSNLNAPDYYLAEICKEALLKISSVATVK